MISIPPAALLVAGLVVNWLPLTCQSALHCFISGRHGGRRKCHHSPEELSPVTLQLTLRPRWSFSDELWRLDILLSFVFTRAVWERGNERVLFSRHFLEHFLEPLHSKICEWAHGKNNTPVIEWTFWWCFRRTQICQDVKKVPYT